MAISCTAVATNGAKSKSGSEAYCADFLAPAGYAVFSINYRLAPKYPYPYMVYDVERSIRFSATMQPVGTRSQTGLRWLVDRPAAF